MSDSNNIYLDVELKLRADAENTAVVTAAYFHGSVRSSLYTFFGDIGGHTELVLVKFDPRQRRGIFKVPEEFYKHTQAAIALIAEYQHIPCHFKVKNTSFDIYDL